LKKFAKEAAEKSESKEYPPRLIGVIGLWIILSPFIWFCSSLIYKFATVLKLSLITEPVRLIITVAVIAIALFFLGIFFTMLYKETKAYLFRKGNEEVD
jgi:hypothetical protein